MNPSELNYLASAISDIAKQIEKQCSVLEKIYERLEVTNIHLEEISTTFKEDFTELK